MSPPVLSLKAFWNMREDARTGAKARLGFPGTSTDEWIGDLSVGVPKPIRGAMNNQGIIKKKETVFRSCTPAPVSRLVWEAQTRKSCYTSSSNERIKLLLRR